MLQRVIWIMVACGCWGIFSVASAAPAPWYWWSSKVDGKRICAQHMPHQGWARDAGPFQNAQCQPLRQSLIQTR